jgi:hypothetical protein
MSNSRMISQPPRHQKAVRVLGADESRKMLELMVNRQFDPDALNGIRLDKREVARFVAEIIRPLRIASISAGLDNLKWLIENTFYEAFGIAQAHRAQNVNLSHAPEDVH